MRRDFVASTSPLYLIDMFETPQKSMKEIREPASIGMALQNNIPMAYT
jgi:hypothetical protein